MKRSWKVVLWSCLALCLYLTAEAFLPPASQPSARAAVGLLNLYQATGSKAMEAGGVQCRYTPSCSHYAKDAVNDGGTLNGIAKTVGRLWRCAPWGGSGYDPAVETRPAAYFAPPPQQGEETPEQRKAREEAQKKAAEEIEKAFRDAGEAGGAACLAGTLGCVIIIVTTLVGLAIEIFMMVYAYKDSMARGDKNAVLWVILIFFLHLVGFIVYMIARPKGDLVPCPNCHQKKLDILTKCPHCSADIGGAAPPAKA